MQYNNLLSNLSLFKYVLLIPVKLVFNATINNILALSVKDNISTCDLYQDIK